MDIAALVQEFQSLIGAYIRKAYQPEREVVVIRLNTEEGRRELVIRTGRAVFLSSKGPENPPQPTGFAMLLRKHLTNGRIVSVEQQEFDRIIILGIQKEERFDLIIEGFGDGNIILVKNGIIIQPLISRIWRHRVVRAGREYEVPPPMVNPRTIGSEAFAGILGASDRDVVRTLAMGLNLGGIYAEEVCLRSGVSKDHVCGELTFHEMNRLWEETQGLFERLKVPAPGVVVQADVEGSREGKDEKVAGSELVHGGDMKCETEKGEGEEEVAGSERVHGEEGEDKERADVGKLKREGEKSEEEVERGRVLGAEGKGHEEADAGKLKIEGEAKKGDEEADTGILKRKGEKSDEGEKEKGDPRVERTKRMVNVLPFPLKIYDEFDYVKKESFNEGVEEYFSSMLAGSQEDDGGDEGGRDSAEVERIGRTIDQQEQSIEKLEQAILENKEKAERLFLRYSEFDKVLNDIREYGEKHGWIEMAESLSSHPLVLEVNTEKKFVIVKDSPTNLRLDYMCSVNENAQRYYEAATRSREKLSGARTALEESRVRFERTRKHESKVRDRVKTERKQFWFERYRWFISSEGNVIIGGKDAGSNDRVVKKYLKERDRYAHAEIHGAPSLVIKSIQNEEMGEQTLEEACIYAACFSRAWKAGIGGVEAFWVNSDQVSKTPAAGEFIARGAFIVRGKRNRIHADLRLAIGKMAHESVEMVMCGPESAVRTYAESYIVFEPGEIPKNDMARKLSKLFDVKNEEILAILPGDVRITRKIGIDWDDE